MLRNTCLRCTETYVVQVVAAEETREEGIRGSREGGPVLGQVAFASTIKQDPTTGRNGRQADRTVLLKEPDACGCMAPLTRRRSRT